MKKAEVQKLGHGLYRIYWKEWTDPDHQTSLASVGSLPNGDRWLAPTNWVGVPASGRFWLKVERVELILESYK